MSEPNVNCTHTRTTHVHGTLQCYREDRCRCDDCRAANAAHSRSRCPGGRETVLDPAEVVVRSFEIGSEYVGTFFPGVHVQDVIDALTGEERMKKCEDCGGGGWTSPQGTLHINECSTCRGSGKEDSDE